MAVIPSLGVRLALAGVAAVLLAVLTYAVLTGGALVALDVRAVAWFHAHRTAILDTVMIWASRLGGPSVTSVYAGVAIVLYLVRRRIAAALAIGAVVYGAALLNIAFKHLVQRSRPRVADAIMTLPTFSFPSGHAVAATVFGGLACVIVHRSDPNGRCGIIAVALALLWILLVSVSRVYLGVHYPTDVVAGVAEGVLWLSLCAIGLDRRGVDLRWPGRDRAFQ